MMYTFMCSNCTYESCHVMCIEFCLILPVFMLMLPRPPEDTEPNLFVGNHEVEGLSDPWLNKCGPVGNLIHPIQPQSSPNPGLSNPAAPIQGGTITIGARHFYLCQGADR